MIDTIATYAPFAIGGGLIGYLIRAVMGGPTPETIKRVNELLAERDEWEAMARSNWLQLELARNELDDLPVRDPATGQYTSRP